ncbi:putative Ig domain-containing protein [Vibrio hepatarius]|uniref:putative Ig domain-containing protein n=1 Tax=Vibrio hepatarius TaxID=171383 RepID=UPI00142D3F91|nr:putative Ig domain-containing protein [Vibrio hepatarius]NIY85064.1 hypothetical protein [Vibrio hepatarius]
MKKMSLLAASVAIALTGCGGGSGSDNTSTAQRGLEITAIDGYLKNAAVWVDTNENLVLDTSEDTKLDVVTNEYGKFTLPEEYKSQTVFIQAVAGQTEDTTRGIVTETFSLASTSGSSVVNPMTNMVVKKVAKQLASDPTLDVVAAKKAAKEEVVAKLTQSGLNVDASMIFGDYIAKSDESKEAQALNAIGEALVDNAEIDVEKQLEVADLVAKEANDIIENNGNITDFAPVITVPTDDSPVVVDKNHRPTSSQTIEPITVVLGGAITSFTASFTDIDTDTLTYELKALKLANGLNGLSINSTTGEISGTPKEAGVFTYQVFATDEHKARSYPLIFTVTVEVPNTAPVINEDVQAQLQAEVDAWYWVEGEQPVDTLNISTLFDDADSDLLTYTVETSLSINGGVETGFQVHVDGNGNVSFDGPVPNSAEAGAEHLYVYAKDSVNADEPYVMFELPAIAEGTTVEPVHPLEGKTWYRLDHGSSDGAGENSYSNIWCDSIRFEDNVIYGNQRTIDNLTSCSAAETPMEGSSYVIKDGTLVATFNGFEDGQAFTETLAIEVKGAADDISPGAQTVVYRDTSDGSGELYTYFSNKTDADKRLTIKSDVGPDGRSFGMYLPAEQYPYYDLGRITVSMTDNVVSHDNNVMDANVFFDIDNKDFTCSEVREFFYQFEFTGKDIGTVVSTDWDGSPIECFTGEEDSGPNGTMIKHAAVDFDLPALTVGNVYSIIGRVKSAQGEYIEAIKFNIEWTGIGDTE